MEISFLKEMNQWFDKHPLLPRRYMHVVLEDEPFDIFSLHRAIVFVHTSWSGPSHFGITNFLSAISQIHDFNVNVYFVNLDFVRHEEMKNWVEGTSVIIRCAGETFWMIHGKVCEIHPTVGWDQLDIIKERIRLFMQVE